MDNETVKGAVAAPRWGPFAFLSDVLLDATGDGDAAAFAGANYVYGSERDHTVMWYSLAQFEKPGRTRNNFTSMVDVSNIEDYTRAILAGRRRGGVLHDHGVYVATRESRHMVGDVIMTLADQMLHPALAGRGQHSFQQPRCQRGQRGGLGEYGLHSPQSADRNSLPHAAAERAGRYIGDRESYICHARCTPGHPHASRPGESRAGQRRSPPSSQSGKESLPGMSTWRSCSEDWWKKGCCPRKS
ncbi:hypothetical protein SAMN05444955_1244 [Lihuaxuella thermophila]|uniref:Uncharacterized protein n=1 Tax=Lihuaxuella thermophila TaxID=1173111 RepID=A0A1H8JEY2_9BACL|nr:hypothetical protein SAMN05444955_1244 [Lihuaxuella thermophila]